MPKTVRGRSSAAAILAPTLMAAGRCGTGGPADNGVPAPGASPGSASGATAAPRATKAAAPTGPGVPEESARVTPQDGRLLERFRRSEVPRGHGQPSEDTLAVILRGADGSGHLGWMTDEQTYCFASVRASGSLSSRCGQLPARHAPNTAAGPQLGAHLAGEEYHYYTALVLDGQGRFAFTGSHPSFGPVHRATVAFPSGRTAALLVYEVLGPDFHADAEIGDGGRTHCFMATASMEDPATA